MGDELATTTDRPMESKLVDVEWNIGGGYDHIFVIMELLRIRRK